MTIRDSSLPPLVIARCSGDAAHAPVGDALFPDLGAKGIQGRLAARRAVTEDRVADGAAFAAQDEAMDSLVRPECRKRGARACRFRTRSKSPAPTVTPRRSARCKAFVVGISACSSARPNSRLRIELPALPSDGLRRAWATVTSSITRPFGAAGASGRASGRRVHVVVQRSGDDASWRTCGGRKPRPRTLAREILRAHASTLNGRNLGA